MKKTLFISLVAAAMICAGCEKNPGPEENGVLSGHGLNGTKWNVTMTKASETTGTEYWTDSDGGLSSNQIEETDTETINFVWLFEGDYIHKWTDIEGETFYSKEKIEDSDTEEDGISFSVRYQLPEADTFYSTYWSDSDHAEGTALVDKVHLEGRLLITIVDGLLEINAMDVEDYIVHNCWTDTVSEKTITYEYKSRM